MGDNFCIWGTDECFLIRLDLFYRKSIVGRANENRDVDAGPAMRAFHMSVVFDMRVDFIMFVIERLKGDVPVRAYAKGKLAGCVAGHKYINEKDNEYFDSCRLFRSHIDVINIQGLEI